MRTKVVKVGIMSFEDYQKYTLAIACGKHKPKKGEPKIWFSSIETVSQVLSTKNIELLKLIDEQKPESIRELASMSGRKPNNLSRTLKTFQRHGIVDFVKENHKKRPIALATQFEVELGKEYPSLLFDSNRKTSMGRSACV